MLDGKGQVDGDVPKSIHCQLNFKFNIELYQRDLVEYLGGLVEQQTPIFDRLSSPGIIASSLHEQYF